VQGDAPDQFWELGTPFVANHGGHLGVVAANRGHWIARLCDDDLRRHDRRVDRLSISAERPVENSIDHKVHQVGVHFVLVMSKAIGDPHEVLNDGNDFVEGELNWSVGLAHQ
jgi:hypothetical protein